MTLAPETVLFTSYASVLLLAACALDQLPPHNHTRAVAALPNLDARRDCTTAPRGKDIPDDTPPWPHSEKARFHRGLVLLLVGLAASLLVVMAVRHHQPGDLALITAPLLACGPLGYWFTNRFRRTPHGFPTTTGPAELSTSRPDPTPPVAQTGPVPATDPPLGTPPTPARREPTQAPRLRHLRRGIPWQRSHR